MPFFKQQRLLFTTLYLTAHHIIATNPQSSNLYKKESDILFLFKWVQGVTDVLLCFNKWPSFITFSLAVAF